MLEKLGELGQIPFHEENLLFGVPVSQIPANAVVHDQVDFVTCLIIDDFLEVGDPGVMNRFHQLDFGVDFGSHSGVDS